MASVVLGDIDFYLTSTLAWQPWHLWHWAGSGGALGFRRGAGDAAAVGVAAVALGDIHLRFTWQAWHFVTSTFTLCGSVALRDMDCYFAWQAWHLWHWAGSGGALGFRRGAGDAAAVGVAGVALRDIYLHFVWAGVALMALGWLWWRAWF